MTTINIAQGFCDAVKQDNELLVTADTEVFNIIRQQIAPLNAGLKLMEIKASLEFSVDDGPKDNDGKVGSVNATLRFNNYSNEENAGVMEIELDRNAKGKYTLRTSIVDPEETDRTPEDVLKAFEDWLVSRLRDCTSDKEKLIRLYHYLLPSTKSETDRSPAP